MELIPFTICRNCQHFLEQQPIWSEQYCQAPEVQFKKVMDPVTGEMGYRQRNSIGDVFYNENPYPYARDINKDGNCVYYREK